MKLIKTIVFAVFGLLVTQFAVAQNHDSFTLVNGDPIKSAKVFPNPATEFVSVKFDAPVAKTVSITVHSIIGNSMEVESEVIDDYEIRLKVKDLPTGYYLLALKSESNSRNSLKFLKH